MKKTFLGVFTLVVSMAMVSCGAGKTAEQIKAEATAAFDKKKTELETAATADCDSKKAAYQQAAADSILAANPAPIPATK
jgi:prefoldin subunit 5